MDLGDATCVTLGHLGGDLSCTAECALDVTACEKECLGTASSPGYCLKGGIISAGEPAGSASYKERGSVIALEHEAPQESAGYKLKSGVINIVP